MSSQQYPDTCRKCGARRIDQQIGLERTPQEFIAKLVAVFDEVRRVLRKDGVVFCNMGDSYAGGGGFCATAPSTAFSKSGRYGTTGAAMKSPGAVAGLKPKDRMMMPARLAIALCDAGWYLRDEIVWAKPSPMPESVTDRCTKAHEMIYMLTRSPRYFYDAQAIAEPAATKPHNSGYVNGEKYAVGPMNRGGHSQREDPDRVWAASGTRTKRSVWTVTSEPYPAAHFATFPRKLIEPCILAGCPETCCAACGAPWVRVVDKPPADSLQCASRWGRTRQADSKDARAQEATTGHKNSACSETLGFKPTCTCVAGTVPGLCLDPFLGSGTTAQVARDLGRRCWGIELNPEYVREHCTKRLEQAVLF